MRPKNFLPIFISVLFFGLAFPAQTQNLTTWKGGAPGQEHEWKCPKNWSDNRVPDQFSDVLIKDVRTTSLASPIIKNAQVEVNSITIESGGHLAVEKSASLVVFTWLNLIHLDCLDSKGILKLQNEHIKDTKILADKVLATSEQK